MRKSTKQYGSKLPPHAAEYELRDYTAVTNLYPENAKSRHVPGHNMTQLVNDRADEDEKLEHVLVKLLKRREWPSIKRWSSFRRER